MKCVADCKAYTGGERKHHNDCPYYPESFTKLYDDLKEEVKELKKEIRDLKEKSNMSPKQEKDNFNN